MLPRYLHEYHASTQVEQCRFGLYHCRTRFFTDDGFGNLFEACIHKACLFVASGLGDQ